MLENSEEALSVFTKEELTKYKIDIDKCKDKDYVTKAIEFCKSAEGEIDQIVK
mgnify:CR=1 FL=1